MKQKFSDMDGKLSSENELLAKLLNKETKQEKNEGMDLTKWIGESRCLLHKPGALNSIPRIHLKVEKKNQFFKVVLRPLHIHHGRCIPLYLQIISRKRKNIWNGRQS